MSSEFSVLTRIIHTARSLELATSQKDLRALPSSPPHIPHSGRYYGLPAPAPISFTLVAIGFDTKTAEQLSHTFVNAGLQLKSKTEAQLLVACRALAVHSSDRHAFAKLQTQLHHTYETKYLQTLTAWTRTISESGSNSRHQSNAVRGQNISRAQFKADGVPILDSFFSKNIFPSRNDKEQLAAQTCMTYKQINVWFQNRRNRSKRERMAGKGTITDTLSLGTQNNRMDNCPPILGPRLEELQSLSNVNPLRDTYRPPHVFPSTYPPVCSYQPFPMEENTRHFARPWIRQPLTTSSVSAATVGLDRLIEMFAHMCLSDDSPNSGIITVVPPAPLPALITARPVHATAPSHPDLTTASSSYSPECFASSASHTQFMLPPSRSTATHSRSPTLPSILTTEVMSSSSQTLGPSHCKRIAPSHKLDKPASRIFRAVAVPVSGVSPPTSDTSTLTPISYPRKVTPLISTPNYRQPCPTSRRSRSRKVVALPKRVPNKAKPSAEPELSIATDSRALSHLHTDSTLSRVPSISSISSASSSESSSSSDSDGLPTPPLLPARLPSPKVPTLEFSRNLLADRSNLFDDSHADAFLMKEGLRVDLLPDIGTRQLEMQGGDS